MTESAAYPKTGQSNTNAKARLQHLLRQIEKASRLAEFRVDRIKAQLRRDLIDLKANKLAMESHNVSYKQLSQMEPGEQRNMLKLVSQRGRYFYSLKSEVKVHIDRMRAFNPRLERAQRLLVPARRESVEAMERGITNLPDIDGSLVAAMQAIASANLREGDGEGGGEEEGGGDGGDTYRPEVERAPTTPTCLIFPRI
ncbi:uncharacterized protein [Diadema antillarum]|uniref:uncharacterized protein n=1 Tax=Diadema antillarum TaxID=105358 RepID=UPI003A83AD10